MCRLKNKYLKAKIVMLTFINVTRGLGALVRWMKKAKSLKY